MPQARRASSRTTAETERADLKREVLAELRDAMYHGGSVHQDVLDALDDRVGDGPDALTYADLPALSVEEHIARKAEVDQLLARGPDPAETHEAEARTPPPRGATGVGIAGSVPETMSWDALRNMTAEEHIAKRDAVEAFLANGGRAA